jgi:hypothetical protein
VNVKTTAVVESSLPESYLRRAFLLQYNLILLGGAALFSLASASPLPLLAGAGLEVLWLALAPNLAAGRRLLDRVGAEAAVAAPESAPPEPAPRPVLEPLYQHRVGLFERILADIRAGAARLDAASQRHVNAGLDAIARSFAASCEKHQRVSKYLASTPEAGLLEEIDRQKRAFSAEKDLALRLAIRQSIALAQRRLDQRAHLEKSLRTATVSLETLERAAGALRAQVQALGLTQELIVELDALRHEIGNDTGDEDAILRPSSAPSL